MAFLENILYSQKKHFIMKELNLNLCFDTISKSRSSLMGLAMIWVVMYHYHLETFPLDKLSRYGFTGVDIFLFLSGMGLYFSMHKNPDVLNFYKRRLLRIFPTYIILGAVATFLLYGSHESLWHFLWVRSTLGYWTNGDSGAWFIPALITLYFFFPFLYHTIFKRDDIGLFILFFGVVLFLSLYWVTLGAQPMWFDNTDQRWLHVLLLYRVPIFMAGAFLGHVLLVRRDLSRTFLIACLLFLFFAPVFYLQRTTMCQSFSTTLISPFLIIVLSLIISRFKELAKSRGGGIFCYRSIISRNIPSPHAVLGFCKNIFY